MADEYLHIKEIVKQSHTRAKEYNQEQLYLNSAMHGAMDGALAFEWERGSITTSTGADNNGSAYLNQYTRSSNFVPVTAGETICKKLNDTIVSTVVFVWYDANGSRVGSNNSTDLEIVVPAGAAKARVYFRRISSGTGELEIGAGVVLYRKGSVLSQNIKEEMTSYYSTRDPLFDPKAVRQAAWRGWNWDSPTYACPMNSWPAYEAAVAGGADMLWIAAVSISKDGVFYAIHDEALQVANGVINMDVTPKKNSDGTWPSGAYPTYSYTAAQLGALVMGSASHTYADPESRRHPIRMSVLLAWAKANGIPVGIRTGRLPSTDGDTVWNSDYTSLTNKQIWESFAEMIKKAGCEKDIFSADGNGVMTCLRKYLPECHLQYHGGMKTQAEGLAGVDKVKAFGGSVSINIYNAGWCREVLEYAQSKGVKTFVAVSDSAGHAFDYAQVPPDYIITTVDDGYGAKTPVMRKVGQLSESVVEIRDETKPKNRITGSFDSPSTFDIVKGIIGSTGKPNQSYQYGVMTEHNIPVKGSRIRVECDGWFIRLAIWDGFYNVTGSKLIHYVNYTEGLIDINILPNATHMYIGVRKNVDDSTPISDAEISEIESKIKVYCNALDDTLTMDGVSPNSKSVGDAIAIIGKRVTRLEYPIGLHTMPKSNGVLNAIKRARQLTDIKWTPTVDLPRISIITGDFYGDTDNYKDAGTTARFTDVFKAGVEYTGFPYSMAKQEGAKHGYTTSTNGSMIGGINVPFESFITSLSNAESMLYKASAYNLAGNEAPVYGTYCNSLLMYAYNLSYHSIPDLCAKCTWIDRIDKNGVRIDPKRIELGDMITEIGSHVAIVTDIITDNEENVTHIEVSESTKYGNPNKDAQGTKYGGICRRVTWRLEDFYLWFKKFTIYRYNYIDTIPYTPSRYVNVEYNTDEYKIDYLPCMPYEGDGFVYKHGFIPYTKILVASEGYSYMRVTKDGQPWNADGTTNYYSVGGNYVNVGFSAIGEYTAYLCNVTDGIETRTKSCHWSVV